MAKSDGETLFKVGVLSLDKRALKKLLSEGRVVELRVEFLAPRSRLKAFVEVLASEPRVLKKLSLIDKRFSPGEESAKPILSEALTTSFFEALPHLESLTLVGHGWFTHLEHAGLETLDLQGYPFGSAASFAPVVHCPKVESLRWAFSGDDHGVAHEPETFKDLWAAKGLPAVKSLDLADVDLDGDLLSEDTFIKGNLLKGLESVSLPKCSVESDVLKEALPYMKGLKRIVIDDEALLSVDPRVEVLVKKVPDDEFTSASTTAIVLGSDASDEDMRRVMLRDYDVLKSVEIYTTLSAECAAELGAFCGKHSELESITIENQGSSGWKANVLSAFASALGEQPALKRLSLTHNRLTEGGRAVVTLLDKCKHVELIDLNHSSLNAEDLAVVVPALSALGSLKEIRIGSSASDEAAGFVWSKFASPTLERFIIWTTKFPDAACKAFVTDMGKRLPNLQTLDHGWSNYNAATLWAMAKGFEGHLHLRDLEIAIVVSNDTYDALEHLLANTKLKRLEYREFKPLSTTLDLSDVRKDGTKCLAKATHLEELSIDGLLRNDDPEVIEHFLQTLKTMPNLKRLDGFRIKFKTRPPLERAVELLSETSIKRYSKLHPWLRDLLIPLNAIEDLSVKTHYYAEEYFTTFAKLFESNDSLKTLRFCGGVIDPKVLKAFKKMMAKGENIEKVYLNMVCPPERLLTIMRALKKHPKIEVVARHYSAEVNDELNEAGAKLKGPKLSFFDVNPKFTM